LAQSSAVCENHLQRIPTITQPDVSYFRGSAALHTQRNVNEGAAMAQATLKNQKKIIANQKTIVTNQGKILKNQKAIVKNQRKILKNQGRILRK
jgi:hypothetical protein